MNKTAFYARVSTQTQEKESTVNSQLNELRKYAESRQILFNESDFFVDEGYSGSSLIRPSLEKLRDAVTEGEYERLLVYDPDRLARNYVYQMLLIEEFEANECSIEFIRNPIKNTPDGQLLQQLQGMIAEYERAKILERTRRGKLHRMRNGEIVHGRKTFGYEYIKKTSDLPAHYKIKENEAAAVRSIFSWYVEDKLTLRKIAQRLNESGISTTEGCSWKGPNMHNILKNPVYTGTGYANRFKAVEPKRRSALQDKYYKYPKSRLEQRPREEWFEYSSPQIISNEIFELAQEQLRRNRELSLRRTKNEYLLRGIIKCGECGLNMVGQKGIYRCPYSQSAFAKEHLKEPCSNKERIKTDLLDEQIWKEVLKLLKNRNRLKQIYSQIKDSISPAATGSIDFLEKKKDKLLQQSDRINELYIQGLLDKNIHKQKHITIKEKLSSVNKQIDSVKSEKIKELEMEEMLYSFNRFTDNIKTKLDNADFTTKRYAVEEIVKSVEVKNSEIILNYAVPLKRKKGTLCISTQCC